MNRPLADISDLLLAHRGYAAAYPENTLPALTAAVALGARMLEFDVQLTADGVPILLHDEDFQRTAGVPACVMDIDFAATLKMDVAERDRFGEQFAGVRAPRLSDVASHLAEWSGVRAFVELKRHSIERFGVRGVLEPVMHTLEAVKDRCVIISFNAEVLVAAREQYGMPIGWALRKYDSASRRRAVELAPDYLFCNEKRLPPAALGLWDGPWQWIVYEIVAPEMARSLFARGVSIVETMAYPELAAALRDAGHKD